MSYSSLISDRPMTGPKRRRRIVRQALVVTLSVVMGYLFLPAEAVAEVSVQETSTAIVARDGIRLDAIVAALPGVRDAPLVVMPGTYAGETDSIAPVARALAERGYVAVYYIERGLGPEGELDGGGPKDIADVSDVITWAQNSLPVDPDRVGLLALSYGGGIALRAAAADTRVTVVAEVAGWTDMGEAFYPNKTPAQLTLQSLSALGSAVGTLSEETRQAFWNALTVQNVDVTLEYARSRSVAYDSPSLADRGIPLFMAHEMNETVFPIDSTIDFWAAYPGPKRLELRPGDHATQELLTPFGQIDDAWSSAMRWLDAYLVGDDISITEEPSLLVVPRSSQGAREAETGDSLSPSSETIRRYLSSRDRWTVGTKALTTRQQGTGASITEGQNWLVHVGLPMWSYLGEVITGIPPVVLIDLVDRQVSQIWSTDSLDRTLALRGSTRVHLELTPSAERGTVVVHLLDLDFRAGHLVAHQPWSWSSQTPGKQITADFDVTYNAYDVLPGHRMAVVVTTSDPMFNTSNPDGAQVRIGPGSWVEFPVK